MHKENEGPILDLLRFNIDDAPAAVLVNTRRMVKTYFSKPLNIREKTCGGWLGIDGEEMAYNIYLCTNQDLRFALKIHF